MSYNKIKCWVTIFDVYKEFLYDKKNKMDPKYNPTNPSLDDYN